MEQMANPGSPAIDVDEVMRALRQQVQERRAAADPPFAAAHKSFAGWSRTDGLVAALHRLADVGQAVPEMTRTSGLTRLVAAPVARGFLRLAQLVTRDQRAYNHAAADALAELNERLADEIGSLRAELESVRAELRSAQRAAAATSPKSSA